MSHLLDFQCRRWTSNVPAIVLICLGFLAACGPSPNAQSATAANTKVAIQAKDTGVKRYALTGRVVSIDKSAQSIVVDGDEIPGFMAAMTMPYQVKDTSALDKLSPGDQIKAEIVLGNDEAYLENIVVVKKASSTKPAK
jgi:Cu/Ag efflux protein CusF